MSGFDINFSLPAAKVIVIVDVAAAYIIITTNTKYINNKSC